MKLMASTSNSHCGIPPAKENTIVSALWLIHIHTSSSYVLLSILQIPSITCGEVDFRGDGLGLPIILVGCKKDLRRDPKTIENLRKAGQWLVTPEEGMDMTQKIGAKQYLECSAISGEDVREVFQCATRAALLSHKGPRMPSTCVVL